MADKRMFSKQIIDSDLFLDMSLSTQALYFHLCMRADDDGFINNPKRIQRLIGCGDDELKLLIAKSFVIPFESGVCVIKHWRIHNYIKTDRYKPTLCVSEKETLELSKNKTYEIKPKNIMEPNWNRIGTELEPQIRLDKNSRDKNREDKNNVDDISKLLSLYEQLGFGSINVLTYDEIQSLVKEYSYTWVEEAFKESNANGVRNLKYLQGILKNWKTKGYKADKKTKNVVKPDKFNNFEGRNYSERYEYLQEQILLGQATDEEKEEFEKLRGVQI